MDIVCGDCHVPCIMVMEHLQSASGRQGCYFEKREKRAKKKCVPYAQSQWFYSGLSNGKIHDHVKKFKHGSKSEGCKKMLVKAHQIKALKMKKYGALFEVEYIADYRVYEVSTRFLSNCKCAYNMLKISKYESNGLHSVCGLWQLLAILI